MAASAKIRVLFNLIFLGTVSVLGILVALLVAGAILFKIFIVGRPRYCKSRANIKGKDHHCYW